MQSGLKGLIYVIFFSIAWAIQTTINKYALNQGIEPLSFSYQTIFGAAIICLVLLLLSKSKFQVKKKHFPRLVSIGVLGSGLGTLLTFYGLKYSVSVNYGFLVKTTVFFSIVLAAIFLKEKITRQKILFMTILIVGAYLVSTGGATYIPHWGDLIIILTAFTYSTVNIISKPLLKEIDADIVTFFRVLIGGIVILLFVPFLVSNYLVVESWFLVIIRSIFLFFTLYFLNKGIQLTTISYITLMSMMYSVFVLILGYFILNETMNFVQIIGAALIILSVIKISTSKV